MQEAADSLARAFDYYFETGDTTNAIAVAEHPVPGATRMGMTQMIRKALTLGHSPNWGRPFSPAGREYFTSLSVPSTPSASAK